MSKLPSGGSRNRECYFTRSIETGETVMRKPKPTMPGDQIVTTMIKLAGCPNLHRIILSGSAAPQRMFKLHRRGYSRVATTATCGLPRGQYDVALVEWQLHNIRAPETTLNWLVHFLAPAGVLVIWIDSEERSRQRTLKPILERLGFRIEAGAPLRERAC